MFVVDESKIVNGTYKGVMQVFSYDNANEIELPWSGQFLVLLRNQFGALPVVDYFEGNRYKLNEAIYHYHGSNVLEFIRVGGTRKTMVLVPLSVQVSAYNMKNNGIKGAYIPELEKEIQKVLEVIRNSGTNVTNKEKAFLNNLKFIEKELTDKTNVVFGKVAEVLNEVALVEQESERFLSLVRENERLVDEKYLKFDTDITEANQTIDDILALQPQFQAVLDETTGKDVISAPEIILARGGEADLKTRLDKEHQEVTAQLAHTPTQIDLSMPTNKRIFFAHRGASDVTPENSLPAFESASSLGFYGVECDIWRTTDDKWVVFHDEDIARMTDGQGHIESFTLSQLREFNIDAGFNISLYPGLKIPTLEEYLDICSSFELMPLIEVKGTNHTLESMTSLLGVILKYGIEGKCSFIFGDVTSARLMRGLSEKVIIHLLSGTSDESLSLVKSLGKNTIPSIVSSSITRAVVEKYHIEGLPVASWGASNMGEVLNLINAGVDFITTNNHGGF